MSKTRFLRSAVCVFACVLIQPWGLAAVAAGTTYGALTADAARTADILGIRQEAEQIVALRSERGGSDSHQLNLRSRVLRKIFEAVLQLQAAESELEFEINYTYDAITREQRKENKVNQFFNAANFAQQGTFGVIGPAADIRQKYKLESQLGLISGGIGTLLPVVGIIYNKFAKASHLTPPAYMSPYLNGKAVDVSHLPPLVLRFLDSPAPGASQTRRQALGAEWKHRFNADMAKKETLLTIDDGKARSQGYLSSRLDLLWSLYTSIEDFDSDLLSLLNELRGAQIAAAPPRTVASASGAEDAARLLRLEPLLAELNAGGDSERQRELRITFLEALLSGSLDMAVASDRCQKELNYQYDIVLEQLTTRQGNFVQKVYEANFIQGGTFGAIAGDLFLKKKLKQAGNVLLVSGGISLGFTVVSMLALHGGWRKNQTGPNSLADFFNLRADHGFSPLVYAYLNSSSPTRSDGKSRRECLMEYWKNNRVISINLENKRNLEKLASMPSSKWDTIKLVLNRVALLSSLREQYNEFNVELLELLRRTWPVNAATSSSQVAATVSPSARAAATMLGATVTNEQSDEDAKLLVTRQVLDGYLSITADANTIAQQVDHEFKVLDRMERERDKTIQITNNVNFLQQGVLGQITTSLGLTGKPKDGLASDRLSITSAGISSGLALASLLEQRGGWRPDKAKPNALGAVFGKEPARKLSPITLKYLSTVAPNSPTSLSRRDVLLKYWKESKVLSVNVERPSVVEALSAEGSSYKSRSESIRLINNRITMLFDLRAVMRSSNAGFGELLSAVD